MQEDNTIYIELQESEDIDFSALDNISVKEVKEDGTLGMELIKDILDIGEWLND